MRSCSSSLAAAACLLAAASLVAAQAQCTGLTNAAKDACDMQAAFAGSTVYPDVIPSFDPSGALYVTYGSTTLGGAQQLSPSKTSSAPTVAFSPVNGTATGHSYLLALVDADSGDPDTLHWLSYGLTAASASGGTLSGGTDAAAYGAPNPPNGNGTHRYVFVLYEQPSSFSLPSADASLPSTVSGARLGWSLSSFVSAAALGNPVGGSFFKAKYDGISIPSTSASSSNAAASASGSASSSSTKSGSSTGSSSVTGTSTSSSAASSASSSSAATTEGSTSGALSVMDVRATGASVAVAAVIAAALSFLAF